MGFEKYTLNTPSDEVEYSNNEVVNDWIARQLGYDGKYPTVADQQAITPDDIDNLFWPSEDPKRHSLWKTAKSDYTKWHQTQFGDNAEFDLTQALIEIRKADPASFDMLSGNTPLRRLAAQLNAIEELHGENVFKTAIASTQRRIVSKPHEFGG